jgi:transposase
MSRRLSKKALDEGYEAQGEIPYGEGRVVVRRRAPPGPQADYPHKVWSPIGERPLVEVHQRYEWTYLYSFVRPKTGEVHWLILPTVNARVFSIALEHFARQMGAGTRRRILLVLDQAGWHTGKEVEVPEGVHLEFLPSASPELQPSERLWPLSNEGVANRHFEEIEDLEEALVERCVALCDQPELIRSYTCYHWWPQAA